MVNSINGLKKIVFGICSRTKSKRSDINNNYYLRLVPNLCDVICFYSMPRQRRTTLKEKVAEHFKPVEVDDPNNYDQICQIEKCGRKLSAKQPSNLTLHVKKCHEILYNEHIKPRAFDSNAMAIKRLEFLQDCAEVIAMGGCSFALLAKCGFKNLVADKISVLVDAGYGDGLTPPKYPAVREYIAQQASKVEEKIKNMLRLWSTLRAEWANRFWV